MANEAAIPYEKLDRIGRLEAQIRILQMNGLEQLKSHDKLTALFDDAIAQRDVPSCARPIWLIGASMMFT